MSSMSRALLLDNVSPGFKSWWSNSGKCNLRSSLVLYLFLAVSDMEVQQSRKQVWGQSIERVTLPEASHIVPRHIAAGRSRMLQRLLQAVAGQGHSAVRPAICVSILVSYTTSRQRGCWFCETVEQTFGNSSQSRNNCIVEWRVDSVAKAQVVGEYAACLRRLIDWSLTFLFFFFRKKKEWEQQD